MAKAKKKANDRKPPTKAPHPALQKIGSSSSSNSLQQVGAPPYINNASQAPNIGIPGSNPLLNFLMQQQQQQQHLHNLEQFNNNGNRKRNSTNNLSNLLDTLAMQQQQNLFALNNALVNNFHSHSKNDNNQSSDNVGIQSNNTTDQSPSYIPLKSRLTSVTDTTVDKTKAKKRQSNNTKNGSWPSDLKKFVENILNTTPAGMLGLTEIWIKDTIAEAQKQEGGLHGVDWSTKDLPDFIKAKSAAIASSKSKKGHFQIGTSIETPLTHILNPVINNKQIAQKKIKSSILERIGRPISSNDNDFGNDSSLKRKNSGPHGHEEDQRREQRKQRFINEKNEEERKKREANRAAQLAAQELLLSGNGLDTSADVIDWDEDTILGTSGQLEKRYLRLTSAPDPSTVRPLHILKKTLALLREKWDTEHNYTYLCDQLKSVRQDLTVQRIKNAFTVEVYEFHARVAIEMGDMGEFNQCQGQLQQLFNVGIEGSVDEFFGYRILYMIFTQNRSELIRVMGELTDDLKNSSKVKLALSIRSSVASNDYYTFFSLRIKLSDDDLAGKLIDQFIDKERIKAMMIVCKSYRPSVPLNFITKNLAFGTIKHCKKWLQQFEGLVWTEKGKSLDCKVCFPIFFNSYEDIKAKGIDIKGQIH